MWLNVLVCVVVCATVYTTPVSTTEVEKVRIPRELIECCPCEGSARSRHDTDAESDSPVGARAEPDDCPCRPRSADSEGAPSMLVPNKVHPLRAFVSDVEPKEDSKHILQPEVEFASSFLNTLKEATDEEYKDALARDAARSAAKAEELAIDTEPRETDKNVVTIVVNAGQDPLTDEDLLIPEASHVQEARCAHPLGRSKLRNQNFKDSNLGASNIQEQYSETESKFPLSNVLKNNLLSRKPLGKSRYNHEISQLQGVNNNDNFDTDDNGALSSNLNPIKESNEEGDRSILSEIVSRPINNLLKLSDIDLLPKPTITEGLSPIAEHFKNKLDQLKTVPNIKQWNLKSVLEPMSDSSILSNNIKEHFSEIKPLFPLGNLLKSKSFDENSVQDEIKSTKSATPKSKLSSVSNFNDVEKPSKRLQQIKLPNLIENLRTKKMKVFQSSEIDTNDNGAFASSVAEQISPINKVKANQRSTSHNLFPTLNLSRLNDVLKPLTSLSLPNLFQDAAKQVETISHRPEDKTSELNLSSDKEDLHTEILDAMPSQSAISIISQNYENGEQSDLPTVCEASSENTNMDQSTDFNAQSTMVVNKSEISEQILNNEGIENSEDIDENLESQRSSEDSDCNVEDDVVDEGTVIPQLLPHEEDDLSCEQNIDESSVTPLKLAPKDDLLTDQTIDQSAIIPRTLAPNNDLAYTSLRLLDQESTTPGEIDIGRTSTVGDNQNTDTKGNFKTVTYKDLQIMSDSLLDKNNKKNTEQNKHPGETIETKDLYPDIDTDNIPYSRSDENQDSLKDNFLEQTTEPKTRSAAPIETGNIDCLKSKSITDIGNKKERKINEMAVDASENFEISRPLIDINPLQLNKIVQPKKTLNLPSLIVRNSDIISSIKTKIPSINDLQSHMRNLITGGAPKENLVPETSSTGIDLISAMSKPQKSKLLPSKHLENINNEIFNLKPLDLSRALENPLNLGINPLNWHSVEVNKKGVLGSSLNLDLDKWKGVIAQPKSQHILGSSVKLPDLTNLRAKMRDSFANLLPVEPLSSNILQDTAGSNPIETLNDKFRSQTEDAVQNIQHTLGSVFKETNESPNILASSFTHPKDFIAELTQKHEDLKDKLEGIRYDLNDRLTSFHEDILEKSKFVLPTFPNENIMSFKPKIAQPIIKSATQNIHAQKRKPAKSKMVSAASNAVPNTISAPRLRAPSSLRSLNTNPMERLASQHIEAATPTTTKQYKPLMPTRNTLKDLQNLRASNLRLPETKQTQIKIAFPSSTSRPQLIEKEIRKPKTTSYMDIKQKPAEKFLKNKYIGKDLKMNRESNSSPTDIKKAKNTILSRPENFILKPKEASRTSKERSTLSDRSLPSNPLKENKQISGLKKAYTVPSWSKAADSSDFLGKIREAFKARLLKTEKGKVSAVKSPLPTEDMSRAASETSKVTSKLIPILDKEPVKENTPYKCRLLCTKDSSEV